MSRRDTIIVAVLVNAALILILFATAVKSDDSEKTLKPTHLAQNSKIKSLESPLQEDLLSELNQYVSTVPTFGDPVEEEIFFPEESTVAFAIAPPPQEREIVIPKKEESSQSTVTVTVKKGDFLEKIAKANNSSVSAIMKANQLASTQLKIGQVLKIPVKNGASSEVASSSTTQTTQKPAAEVKPKPSAVSSGEDFYVVKEGDNPWLISSRNHLKLEELLRLNGLDEQKARRLRPGDRLRIR